jgi:hypothetical protein
LQIATGAAMTSRQKPKYSSQSQKVKANISGTISGQVAIGENITQTQTIKTEGASVTEADLVVLRKMIVELKEQITTTAPIDKQTAALEKVSELEEAITAKKPDISTMEYIRNWFGKNLPQLAGAVTGLVVNPIVGKLVEAAGETIAYEFKRRLGQA